MQRIIILGVGTEIGKTWVASALARSARPGTCVALKPVETGCTPHAGAADAAALAAAAGHDLVPPLYALPDPVTPWLAADRIGKTIELHNMPRWAAQQQPHRDAALRVTTCIIETAGGVFSPLSPAATNLDLAHVFEPAAWVLVAANRLGVLHDVGATLTAMAALRRPPDVLVLTQREPEDASTTTNLSLLRRLHPAVPILATSTLEPPRIDALLHQARLA